MQDIKKCASILWFSKKKYINRTMSQIISNLKCKTGGNKKYDTNIEALDDY